MKKSTRTALSFKEDQMELISKLKEALKSEGQKDLSSREIFLIAMAFGFSAQNKISGWKRLNNGVRLEYMQPKDSTLIAAVGIAEFGSPGSLREVEMVYDIAEDYAAGGFALLGEAMQRERNFHAWLESEVFSSYKVAMDKSNDD